MNKSLSDNNMNTNKHNFSPNTDNSMDDMESMLAMNDAMLSIREGQMVSGIVLSVDNSGVIVDIGYKSEGFIPANEFDTNEEGIIPVKPGDKIQAFVVKRETDNGLVSLSKEKADIKQGWTMVKDACSNHTPIEGKITAVNKSGIVITISGLKAFMPYSQSGFISSEAAPKMVGQKIVAHIIEVDERDTKIIASRKELVGDEKKQKKKEFFDTLTEGVKITGTIKSITSFGAFVDIGGYDGLLHISDMSWTPVKSAEDAVKVGQKLELIILKIDKASNKVSLGLKQTYINPWELMETKYSVGSIIHGTVTSMTDYGAFVELEPGIEGMIHVSEMSWTQRIKHPKELLTKGKEVQVKVLAVDKNTRRISLGLRQTTPDPWAEVEKKYGVGTIVKGTLTSINEYGLFVKIEEGIEGLIHVNDLAWNKTVNPSEVYQVGQEIESRVVKVISAKRRLGLGIKQLSQDPWLVFTHDHKDGSSAKGIVKKITEGGIQVEFPGGVDAFCPAKQLDAHRIGDAHTFCKVGDEIEFKILRLDKKERKLSISRRAFVEDQEKSALRSYMKENNEINTNLGDLLQNFKINNTTHTEEK